MDTIPIYRLNNNWLVSSRMPSNVPDLHTIIINLIRESNTESNTFESRLILVFTYLADARGGEAKFLTYKDWYFDPFVDALELKCRELKTLTQYRLTFLSEIELWSTDIFHSLATYWMLDNGLYRAEIDATMSRCKKSLAVFHRLQECGEG